MASESLVQKILQSIDLEDLTREIKDYALVNGRWLEVLLHSLTLSSSSVDPFFNFH